MEHIGVFMDGSCLIQHLQVLLLFWKLDLKSVVKSYLSLQPPPEEFLWPAESCGYYCKGLSATWRSYKTKHVSRAVPRSEPSVISKDNQISKDMPGKSERISKAGLTQIICNRHNEHLFIWIYPQHQGRGCLELEGAAQGGFGIPILGGVQEKPGCVTRDWWKGGDQSLNGLAGLFQWFWKWLMIQIHWYDTAPCGFLTARPSKLIVLGESIWF